MSKFKNQSLLQKHKNKKKLFNQFQSKNQLMNQKMSQLLKRNSFQRMKMKYLLEEDR